MQLLNREMIETHNVYVYCTCSIAQKCEEQLHMGDRSTV
jgi:hypothetical protein